MVEWPQVRPENHSKDGVGGFLSGRSAPLRPLVDPGSDRSLTLWAALSGPVPGFGVPSDGGCLTNGSEPMGEVLPEAQP